jgi:hypothetical protein
MKVGNLTKWQAQKKQWADFDILKMRTSELVSNQVQIYTRNNKTMK